jgi:hypothetical protein
VVAGVVLVPVAWASHVFTDVPDSSPFHDDISAIAGAGITAGKTCDPPGSAPTYCPSEPITREAMAAYVHRGFDRLGWGYSNYTELSEAAPYQFLAPITVTTGGVPGGTQIVLLTAQLNVSAKEASTGCPCNVLFKFRNSTDDDPGGVPISPGVWVTTDNGSHLGDSTGALTWAASVPAATTLTFWVGAELSGTTPVDVLVSSSAIVAPFGSTGASTLAAGEGASNG